VENGGLFEITYQNTSTSASYASDWTAYVCAQFVLCLLNHKGTAMAAWKGITEDLHKLTLVFQNVQLQESFPHLSDAKVQ
jgi:hypothetical protein